MMKSPFVVFIGLREYDNLGIGYMSGILENNGFRTRVIDINKKKSEISRIIRKLDPLLVGFSVIYLHNLNKFKDLMGSLRQEGIDCHFTAGGHYASLKHEELFGLIPALDSIVRFEGEYTTLELLKCISEDSDLRNIKGLAFRYRNKVEINPLRPFEKDLDNFPFPRRSVLKTYAFWKKCATIIAGRGCTHNCSFCNTRKFYSQMPGKVRRIRRPEMVVKEMEMLYRKRNCEIFLFLDDDFPLKSVGGEDWITKFCNELQKTGLSGKILWKINCRPDEVDEKLFALMKSHGLFNVFLGIEDGTDSGLKRMNKKMTAEDGMRAVEILKKLKIRLDFGFLLFQPQTTFLSLNENLNFLGKICGDGYAPVTFLKMMPFYETRIEKELIKVGRLNVSPEMNDYDFLEESMNYYYNYINDCFWDWLKAADGLENTASWAGNYIAVYLHYFDVQPYARAQIRRVRKIVSESNLFLIGTMKEMATYFEYNKQYGNDKLFLESYRESIKEHHEYYRSLIINTMARLISFAQDYTIRAYLQSLGNDAVSH